MNGGERDPLPVNLLDLCSSRPRLSAVSRKSSFPTRQRLS